MDEQGEVMFGKKEAAKSDGIPRRDAIANIRFLEIKPI